MDSNKTSSIALIYRMDLSDSQTNLSVKFIFMYCRVPSHFLCVEPLHCVSVSYNQFLI